MCLKDSRAGGRGRRKNENLEKAGSILIERLAVNANIVHGTLIIVSRATNLIHPEP